MSVNIVEKSIITVQCANTAVDLMRELGQVPSGARLIEIEVNEFATWTGDVVGTNLTARFEYTHEGKS